MRTRHVAVLLSLGVFGTTVSFSAQQPPADARLVRIEGKVTLDGRPIAADAALPPLGDAADLQTTDGRAVVALKRGGAFVLGANSSARVHRNGVYNFNRIEMAAGSAVLVSASSSPIVTCGTEARLSTGGVFRFDVLAPEPIDGTQRCHVRVNEGAASTPGVTVTYVLRDGQEMVMNRRAGDMIPVSTLRTVVLDDLDRWAREQAAAVVR